MSDADKKMLPLPVENASRLRDALKKIYPDLALEKPSW
jgi:hypothetical protein